MSHLHKVPADIAATVVLVVLTLIVVLVPGVRETPVRIVLGLPFVLFLPGYAVIAALFPDSGPGRDSGVKHQRDDSEISGQHARRHRIQNRGICGIERVALSFGLSVAIVPLIGLVLNFTPWGIRLLPILTSISGITLLAAAVGTYRRLKLPSDERFRVPIRAWMKAGRRALFSPGTRTDAILNLLLIIAVLLAVTSIGWAIVGPNQGEGFTEFYLLSENENEELTADNYPTEFSEGEGKPIVVGIGNHEHQLINYTVVVELQRVDYGENGTQVTDRARLNGFQAELRHNETRQVQYQIQPGLVGERLRLVFLLFEGAPPPQPSIATAYREVHLWVNVSNTSVA